MRLRATAVDATVYFFLARRKIQRCSFSKTSLAVARRDLPLHLRQRLGLLEQLRARVHPLLLHALALCEQGVHIILIVRQLAAPTTDASAGRHGAAPLLSAVPALLLVPR